MSDLAAEIAALAGELRGGREALLETHDRVAEALAALAAAAAAPMPVLEPDLDEIDQAILRALDNGALVTQLPAVVGLSRRQASRRMAALRERTGVATSFQLGRVAEARGWLRQLRQSAVGS